MKKLQPLFRLLPKELSWTAKERRFWGLALIAMGIQAVATSGYAYLLGPMLRSLFNETTNDPFGFSTSEFSQSADWFAALFKQPPPLVIALLIVGAAAVKSLAQFGSKILCELSSGELMRRIRASAYRGILRLNPLDDRARNRGDLIARLTGDIQVFERAITEGYVAVFRETLQIAALIAVAFLLDVRLAAMGLIAFPPIAWGIGRLGRRVRQRRTAISESFGAVGTQMERTLSGLTEIQAFALETEMATGFADANRKVRDHSLAAVAARAASTPINEILAALALGGTLLYAHTRISDGTLTGDRFISLFTALMLLYRPIKGLGLAQHAIQAGGAAFDRVKELYRLGAPPLASVRPVHDPVPTLSLANLSAGYRPGEPILKEITFTVRPGERIAIVGPSGAGKSTLVRLLLGQLAPTAGQVLINDHPVTLANDEAGGLFAPVPQQPVLFPGTIYTNIACAGHQVASSDVERACGVAGVLEFTTGLENGLQTVIGPDGGGLSVGQQQRVCLARALISPAPILLLDEVTAALDGITEELIRTSLLGEIGHRSLIIITHRPSTAAWADRIWILDNGTIAAYDHKHHALFHSDPHAPAAPSETQT